jgi:hypothetical protein
VLTLIFVPLFHRIYRNVYLNQDDATYGQQESVSDVMSITSATVTNAAQGDVRIVTHQFSSPLPPELLPKEDKVTLLKYQRNWYLQLTPKQGITWWLDELERKHSEPENLSSVDDYEQQKNQTSSIFPLTDIVSKDSENQDVTINNKEHKELRPIIVTSTESQNATQQEQRFEITVSSDTDSEAEDDTNNNINIDLNNNNNNSL